MTRPANRSRASSKSAALRALTVNWSVVADLSTRGGETGSAEIGVEVGIGAGIDTVGETCVGAETSAVETGAIKRDRRVDTSSG